MQQELNISFKGPSVEAIAAQAAAFAKRYAVTGAATAAPSTKAAKKVAAAAAVEETEAEEQESAFGSDEDDTTETLGGGDEETTEDQESEASEESFDDLATEPANKKTAATGKGKAAPKVTLKDVNAALVAYTKNHSKSKDKTVALLKKHFKVESVNELKPDQYAAVIKAVTPPKK